MKAKFVNEALESNTIRDMLEKLINEQVRTKNTRAKLVAHLDAIFSFTEENPTLDKKGLTRATNDLSNVVSGMYGNKVVYKDGRPVNLDQNGIKLNKETYDKELLELAINRGYKSVWDAGQEKKDQIFLTLMFSNVYGLIEAKNKYNKLQSLELNSKEQEFAKKWFPFLDIWAELGNKLEEIQKILTPTKQQKQEKELKIIKGSVSPEIKSAIDEIAENFRQVIEENEYNWYMRMIKEFQEKFPNGMNTEDRRKNRSTLYLFQNLSRFVVVKDKNNYYINPTHIIKEKPEELARKLAYDTSVETVASWQFKMYNKLGGFMSELGKEFKTSVYGRLGRNDITFEFEDGSQFSIKNQIVNKVSNLGTYFYTYPTTFHNAFLPDKTKIANPNEYTVKKAFNDYKN